MIINEGNIFIYIQKKENDSVKGFLTKSGVDVIDPEQRTSLINATFYNNIELMNWLIENGANVDAQDLEGFTALHFACQENYIESVKILLAANANMNIVDIYGNTPSWITIMNWKGGENFPVLKELYRHNADLTIKNKVGKSAIDIIPESIMNQLVSS